MSVFFYRPPVRTGSEAPSNTLQASGSDRVIASLSSVVLTTGTGQGLTVNSTGATIMAVPARSVTTGNTSINMSLQDSVVLVDTSGGSGTINLPDASTVNAGRSFLIKDKGDAGTNSFTLSTNGGDIDGGASITINEAHVAVTLVCDGTNYWIG